MRLRLHPHVLALAVATFAATPVASQDLNAPRPIEAVETVFLEEMTWMEVRDALAEGRTTAIVATGGIEQNGPYVATGKHNFVLEATTEAIAHRLGDALVAPLVKFVPEGSIDPPTGHMRYHSTISVRQETFEALLTDVVRSLEVHGFTDIVLIGDSGGNARGMENVAAALNRDWSHRASRVHFIPEYYDEDIWSCEFLKAELDIHQQPDECAATRNEYHDDYHYSSIVATTDPERIRARQRIDAGLFSINGVDLAPLERTIENGRRLVEYRADLTVRAIRASIDRARSERAVRDRLEGYYDAFSDRDWARFADHFWPGATLTTVWAPPGEDGRRVVATSVPDFVAQAPMGPGSREIFEERPLEMQITVDGDLAQVWSRYTARFGDPGDVMEWTGADAFTLIRHEGEWRITSLAYASDG